MTGGHARGPAFKVGCTVRSRAVDSVALIRQLVERWNAGDIEGVVDLYTEDGVMLSGSEWPEQTTWRGREGIRASIEDWRAVWESSTATFDRIEAFGDKVLATGAWISRGRASGARGRMPMAVVFTVRNGKIAVHEWFVDHNRALAAARDA
jgi:uncharacterized protein (TIGR02246 family)